MLFNYFDNIVLPNITEKIDNAYRNEYHHIRYNQPSSLENSVDYNPPSSLENIVDYYSRPSIDEYIDKKPIVKKPIVQPVFNIHFENLPKSLTSFDLYCEINDGQLNCKMK